ncbi:TraB/GumN family protein [Oceanobacillus luteolus]|uniref:TraB/GumN family protein n=1 Tax=Oceanobacillus luteolus TaxID=1274358 RepID=A0ABW4HNB8_9BACI|nr:TraB/GumN family protein [Oceanobacillus luteolus]MCM3741861.1 TraB/GumN family protein [Oceanobacillus luteolus]
MKRRLSFLLLLFMALFLAACQNEEPVYFTDAQLETVLREEINKPEGELFVEDFEELTELDLSGIEISDLEGLELLHQLEIIHLTETAIPDLSPLTELEALEEIFISEDIGDEQQATIEQLIDADIAVHWVEPEIVGSPDGPGGFLWKVENDDTTVYLQGTIHVGTEDLFPMHETIENAYKEADIIVPEIDLNNLNPIEMQNIMMELGTFQDGTTIEDHLSEESYEALDAFFTEQGIPLGLMKTYQPWLLSSFVQQLLLEELGYTEGVDEYFLSRAEKDGKEIIALETAEEQFHVLASASLQYQIQMLEESLVRSEEFNESMQELLQAYMEGDADKMLEDALAEEAQMTEEDEAFMEALNDNRNYNMAEQIVGFLEQDDGQTYFVIVGALHYILEPHIISILKDEGYVVEHIH